jgi:D-3-phosphoglycerate dehydrogenase / 2-oxoglutarate reductase
MIIQKVLFIDSTHSVLMDELARHGFECHYFESFGRSDYQKIAADYTGIIIRGKIKLDSSFLTKAKKLKFIGRVGSGMENIDLEYCRKAGIECFNAPEGNRDAVAEHALGMLLMLMNKLRKADREVRQGIWLRAENRGLEIKGKTIAIIGYGNMGSAFAKRLRGFDCHILAYDKYKNGFSDIFVDEANMKKIFEQADILSLHVPLTDETTWMVDDKYISRFKKNIFLINTARGKVVKTADLVKNLKSGKVIGAALDVLEYEKLSFEGIDASRLPEDFQYLINSDEVVLSPHIAGWTHESHYKLAKVIADKILGKFQ